MNTKNKRFDSDDEDEYISRKGTLGYYVQSRVANQFTVNIDEPFVAPSYYRDVISMLNQATKLDSAVFMINSPGGAYQSLVAMIEAVKMTDAATMAVLVGEVSSAASIFALHCDSVFVSDNATMLCHYVSYGTQGKGSDVLAHVEHTTKVSNKLVRDTYKYFLTDQEIEELIAGRQIYLDAEEIRERLDIRQAALEAEQAKDQDQTEPPAKPVKRKKG